MLISLHTGTFLDVFLVSADFFKINFFSIFFQEYHHRVRQFGSRSGQRFVGLILVQTVCKWYQQMTVNGWISACTHDKYYNLMSWLIWFPNAVKILYTPREASNVNDNMVRCHHKGALIHLLLA